MPTYGTAIAEGFDVVSTRTAVLAIVGFGCVAAAGTGAYLGVRSVTPAAAAPETATVAPPATAQTTVWTGDAPESPAKVDRSRPVTSEAAREATSRPRRVDGPSEAARKVEPADRSVNAPTLPPVIAPDPVVSQPASISTAAPEPAVPEYVELIVSADSVIGIQLDAPVSSETARVEDLVLGRVVRDVKVGGRTAISAGTRVEGTVTEVDRGGSFRERARVGIRFHTLVLGDRTRIPIQSEAIFREGDAPGKEAIAKVGASAVVGAIVGGIFGGAKGAAIGSTAGAAGGTAVVKAGGPNEAVISDGTSLTIRLLAPVTVNVPSER
jgi:hypothetical protein